MSRKNPKNKKVKKETLDFYLNSLQPKLEEIVNSLGYTLNKLVFVTENEINYLRLTIARLDHTISIEDCEKVSRGIEAKLDNSNSIPISYTLEVESPGISVEDQEVKTEFVLNHSDMLWTVRV